MFVFERWQERGTREHAAQVGAAIAPGRRTLTMNLPPPRLRTLSATSSALPRSDDSTPASFPALTSRLLNAVVRPDLYELQTERDDDASPAPALSFEALIARGAQLILPAAVKEPLEEAHARDLSPVRLWHIPALADLGMAGLSRGLDVAIADANDLDTLEHELGHVIASDREAPLEANASIAGLPFAYHPSREAHADELGGARRGAKVTTEESSPRHAPVAPVLGAPQARLTRRADITGSSSRLNWQEHRTSPERTFGGYEGVGLGALLATPGVRPTFNPPNKQHDQLLSLDVIVTPELVRERELPAPLPHMKGFPAVYIQPAELLGAAIYANRVFVPHGCVDSLTQWKKDVVKHAKRAPGQLKAKTTFGEKQLAQSLVLEFVELDSVSGHPAGRRTTWNSTFPDPKDWGDKAAPPVTRQVQLPRDKRLKWKTNIEWKKITQFGDGHHVIAKTLGPDHKLGSPPRCQVADERAKKLQAAAGVEYVAGHLLNEQLGGPGDLPANLAPIPSTANAQMQEAIEKPAKRIVNEELGWIRYEVKVTHSYDKKSKLLYPSTIVATMQIYRVDGTLPPQRQTSKITIPAPSDLRGQSKKVKTSTPLRGCAELKATRAFDEVVLTTSRDLRPFLMISRQLSSMIGELKLARSASQESNAAWQEIQIAQTNFFASSTPASNRLKQIADAIKVWRTDPVARDYLKTIKVAELGARLEEIRTEADKFVSLVQGNLQLAQSGQDSTISVESVLHGLEELDLARELVNQYQGADVDMLRVLAAQAASQQPLQVAKPVAPSARGADEPSRGSSSRPLAIASPTTVWKQTGSTQEQINIASQLGVASKSRTAMDLTEVLIRAIDSKEVAERCRQASLDEKLKDDDLIQAMIIQLDTLRSPQTKLVIDSYRKTWGKALEHHCQSHPEIIAAFSMYVLTEERTSSSADAAPTEDLGAPTSKPHPKPAEKRLRLAKRKGGNTSK